MFSLSKSEKCIKYLDSYPQQWILGIREHVNIPVYNPNIQGIGHVALEPVQELRANMLETNATRMLKMREQKKYLQLTLWPVIQF